LLVRSLFRELMLRAEVLARLRGDASLNEPVRAAALAIAERWPEDPDSLNISSWAVVWYPNGRHADYLQALRYAEEAAHLLPDDPGIVNPLAVALYRVGHYREALDALRRSEQLWAKTRPNDNPNWGDVAFLAMVHHQLGQQDEARRYLKQYREL